MIGVVVAANGYPENYEKGAVLHGLDAVSKEAFVFHAGTKNGSDGNLKQMEAEFRLQEQRLIRSKKHKRRYTKRLKNYNVTVYFTAKISASEPLLHKNLKAKRLSQSFKINVYIKRKAWVHPCLPFYGSYPKIKTK